jgi:signal transduction histidine kinase
MKTFRAFLITSAVFIAAPLPLAAGLTFKLGGWLDALLAIAGGLGLGLLYWWPLGAYLSRPTGRTWTKLVGGYLLSIPLYFLTLAVLYPAWGGAVFHPFAGGRWAIYLSATPQFYAMVLLLSYLTKGRTARWALGTAVVALAAGIVAPLYLTAAASPHWPRIESSHAVITGARLVDASSNRIAEGQNVYIQNGRIETISPEPLHPDWPRIEARGRYLLPGLIDVHTHLQSPVEVPAGFKAGYFTKSVMGNYGLQRSAYLASGVTSVRDLGGPAEAGYRLRSEILQKKTLGPRFFTVGRLVTSPHGHPVSTIWSASVSRQSAILATDERTMLDGLDRNFADGPPDAVKFVHGARPECLYPKQVNPHFLFNSLNTIRGMVVEDPARAQHMITSLASLLRRALQSSRAQLVPLADEMDAVADYLSLEATRFEERLQVSLEIDPDARKFTVPAMLVQTLVENAVKHGISQLSSGGTVCVRGIQNHDALVLEVKNPGKIRDPDPNGTHTGLDNARERLRLFYGDRATLELSESNGAVTATVLIPGIVRKETG